MSPRTLKMLPWIVTPSLVIVIVFLWWAIVTFFNVNPFIFLRRRRSLSPSSSCSPSRARGQPSS